MTEGKPPEERKPITPLRNKDLTPQILINNMLTESENFEAVYAVVKYKDGEYTVWASGYMKDVANASLILQECALDYAKGRIYEER